MDFLSRVGSFCTLGFAGFPSMLRENRVPKPRAWVTEEGLWGHMSCLPPAEGSQPWRRLGLGPGFPGSIREGFRLRAPELQGSTQVKSQQWGERCCGDSAGVAVVKLLFDGARS